MRIAVHPDLHSRGIGSEMLSKLLGLNEYEYYSSSFGATEELIRFWHNNEFVPIKLGSHKDQASGTYSVVMVPVSMAGLMTRNSIFVMRFATELVARGLKLIHALFERYWVH